MSTLSLAPGISGAARLTPTLSDLCLAMLSQAQNADGGWGYQPGAESATEPTAWAVAALEPAPEHKFSGAAIRGVAWLESAQLEDGSWPVRKSQPPACWSTALAALTLHRQPEQTDRVRKALGWLCATWPAEGGLWWRVRSRLQRQPNVTRQDSSLRGWSWIPGTASWVEPTAYSLILLRTVSAAHHPKSARERRRLGESMLFDRMCPGGGWNSGNPLVYGVAGEPRVGPTVWALSALSDHPERVEVRQSLAWLGRIYPEIPGPGSMALAHTCLTLFGRAVPPIEAALRSRYATNRFLGSPLVTAWALLALNSGHIGKPTSTAQPAP